MSEVDPELLARLGMFEVASRAPDKAIFLQRPDLGRALSDEGRAELTKRIGRAPTLVVIYGDGLSAAALNQHLAEFHASLERALAARGIGHAPPFFVRRSRVKIMDEIARLVGAQAALFVCGERPGLGLRRFDVRLLHLSAGRRRDGRRPRGDLEHQPARARAGRRGGRRGGGDRTHPAREEVRRRSGGALMRSRARPGFHEDRPAAVEAARAGGADDPGRQRRSRARVRPADGAARAGDHHRDVRRRALRGARSRNQGLARRRRLREVVLRGRELPVRARSPASASASTPGAIPPRSTPRSTPASPTWRPRPGSTRRRRPRSPIARSRFSRT